MRRSTQSRSGSSRRRKAKPPKSFRLHLKISNFPRTHNLDVESRKVRKHVAAARKSTAACHRTAPPAPCTLPRGVSRRRNAILRQGTPQARRSLPDLAQAGIGVLIAEELKLGEVASLVFSLPETSQEWEVQAVLRHRRGYHYGFEFLSLSRERAEALAGYVEGLQRADFD